MKNRNVSYFKGDIETTIKNGDFKQILIYPGLSSAFLKLLDSFQERKEIEASADFPYAQTILKFKSPFRIGQQQIRLINIENIISKNNFNDEQLKLFLQQLCSKFKGSIILFPFSNGIIKFTSAIETALDKFVRDTKIVISA